ncbi:MAG: T9SS type A sorting domain-containing protein [Bacteroidetes bacterium]|nr:T9SS type A sorting domain-containing protein [Bacteroidota bacterium]
MYTLSKKICFLVFFVLFANTICAQDLLHCGADEMRISTLKKNPTIAKAVAKRDLQLEEHTKQYVDQFYKKQLTSSTYIIPVVFHVIHNYGAENISDAQIKDAISVLNKRFRKQSADTSTIVAAFKPLHADCEIEFRLATLDPNGNCTSGINRIASSLTAIGDHSVKSLIHWPPEKYLNIYVVQNAAGLAGHAVWPADADTIPAWDGIVMSHNYVGSIGTSNPTSSVVLAHECGHYLNLHHIWGGNNVPGFYYLPCADLNKSCSIDDLVADTPPTIGWVTCNLNGSSCGNTVDMVQNVMDYSYCNKMFTYGQKARMHACLNDTMASRNNLWQPANLIATGVSNPSNVLCKADFTGSKNVVCANSLNQVTFTNTSYHDSIVSMIWSFPGGAPSSSTAASPVITYTNAGVYSVSLKVYTTTDSAIVTKLNCVSVLPTTSVSYPFSESFETVNSLYGPQWFANSMDTVNAWQITNTASYSGSVSVMLSNANNPMETRDELYSRIINLSGASSLSFNFKYAFARKDTSNKDQLQVYIGNNCAGWIQRLSLVGAALETAPIQSGSFMPTNSSQWMQANITIPLAYYTSTFRIKFVFSSKGGNNFYLDDISIGNSTGVQNLQEVITDIKLFPNPSEDNVSVSFDLIEPKELSFSVVDVSGRIIFEREKQFFSIGAHVFSFDLNTVSSGVYFLKVVDGKQSIARPLVVGIK